MKCNSKKSHIHDYWHHRVSLILNVDQLSQKRLRSNNIYLNLKCEIYQQSINTHMVTTIQSNDIYSNISISWRPFNNISTLLRLNCLLLKKNVKAYPSPFHMFFLHLLHLEITSVALLSLAWSKPGFPMMILFMGRNFGRSPIEAREKIMSEFPLLPLPHMEKYGANFFLHLLCIEITCVRLLGSGGGKTQDFQQWFCLWEKTLAKYPHQVQGNPKDKS